VSPEKNRKRAATFSYLDVMRLAGELGSVVEACRRLAVDRSAYYRAIRKAARTGPQGRRSTLAKPVETESRLIALCLEYPEWGCDRLAWYLTLKGEAISSPTAQKILIRHGLGRAADRRAAAKLMKKASGRDSKCLEGPH
jgi:hypothetical protein